MNLSVLVLVPVTAPVLPPSHMNICSHTDQSNVTMKTLRPCHIRVHIIQFIESNEPLMQYKIVTVNRQTNVHTHTHTHTHTLTITRISEIQIPESDAPCDVEAPGVETWPSCGDSRSHQSSRPASRHKCSRSPHRRRHSHCECDDQAQETAPTTVSITRTHISPLPSHLPTHKHVTLIHVVISDITVSEGSFKVVREASKLALNSSSA